MATSCFVAAQHLALPQRGLLSQQQQQQLRRRHAALHNCGRRNCWRLFRRKRRIGCYLEEPGKRSASAGGHEDSSATGIQLYSQIERVRGFLNQKLQGLPVLFILLVAFLLELHLNSHIAFFLSVFQRSNRASNIWCWSFFGICNPPSNSLSGSRYAIQRSGNVLMAFNNKEASVAVPLFSPVIVPMAQSFGPVLSQLTSSPTFRMGAEMAIKQLENFSPPIMRQVLPLLEQLPPLYMDLVKGREDFTPKPEETRRLIKSYYGVSRNLLIKFKDDNIDETPTLAQVLSSESAISSALDMSIRSMPGDHGLPLQQVIPDVPPAMADAVNRGGELIANLTAGTPWEAVAKEVGNTLGTDSGLLRAQISKDVNMLVDVIASWMASNSGPRILRP
ncbi:uncharacterized protein LOC109711510 isoform X4 [Ananas comosus]|uniref:Uncharacterized protein LOC109711510 isoform X4 n=1 Tax=Ananas comosus TaxID=4615 RepID=A0A6P5F3H2_ANACO|nr:uncharacterized protein LOC109711510 isoform X4 [Ananas comosus]